MTKETEQNIVSFNVGGQKFKELATPKSVAKYASKASVIALQEVSAKKWTTNFISTLEKHHSEWESHHGNFTSSDQFALAWRSDTWSLDSSYTLSNIGKYCSYPLTHLKTKQVINFIVVHLPFKKKLFLRIELLRKFLEELHKKYENYIVLGDFNLSPELIKSVLPKGAIMSIKSSDVKTTPKGNSIDNFISNMKLKLSGPKRIGISDHYPIEAIVVIPR